MFYSANISRNHPITDTRGQVTDGDGVVEQDNHYYPYGMLMGESSDILTAGSNANRNPYLYGAKEYLTTAAANLLDFTARTYDPSLPLFHTQDPESESYTSFNPYLYCGSDPVNRIDPDGREWFIDEKMIDGILHIDIRLTGVVYNNSSKSYDLNDAAQVISKQIENAFTMSFGGVNVTMTTDLRVAYSSDDISYDDHIFAIVNQDELPENVLGHTLGYGIELGTRLMDAALAGDNIRSIPHEVGHSGGLRDTNKERNKLPITSPDINLMTQIGALPQSIDKNYAKSLEPIQIFDIVKQYNAGALGRFSLLHFKYSNSLYRMPLKYKVWDSPKFSH